MDDLISRKRLLEHISAWQQANAGAETQTEYAVIESCYRMAQNFPTAYDVEAVVGELEDVLTAHEKQYDKYHDYFSLGVIGGIKTAIEIVKAGGRNEEHFN